MKPDFLEGIRYLCELHPNVYDFDTLKFWTESQLDEELAAVALQEDFSP
jgi:hypothetical protein